MAARVPIAYMAIMVRPNAPDRFNEEKATYVMRGDGEGGDKPDLTRGADILRSQTYSAFFPLLSAAAFYLVLVIGLEKLLGSMEARLAQSDR